MNHTDGIVPGGQEHIMSAVHYWQWTTGTMEVGHYGNAYAYNKNLKIWLIRRVFSVITVQDFTTFAVKSTNRQRLHQSPGACTSPFCLSLSIMENSTAITYFGVTKVADNTSS